jgi:putative DNA primase/helicase
MTAAPVPTRASLLRRHDWLDLAAIGRAALPRLEDLCRRWLPGGRRVGAEWICGSLRGEPGASCKVNLRTGRWADFATGEKGGDAVSLAAAIHGLTQAEAARRLAATLGLPSGEATRRG